MKRPTVAQLRELLRQWEDFANEKNEEADLLGLYPEGLYPEGLSDATARCATALRELLDPGGPR